MELNKKLILIAMLVAGYALGYFFYLSWAGGFAISKFCGGKESGKRGRFKSLIIPLRKHELHLHHWVLSSIAAIAGIITGFHILAPEFFYGLLGGAFFQGIYCYNDWHRIIKRKPAFLREAGLPPAIEYRETAIETGNQ